MLQTEANRHLMKFIHDLVLEEFVGPRPRGTEACHWDGNKQNNRLGNLRWDTPLGNQQDSRRLGQRADFRGSKNGRATIGEEQAAEIKRLALSGVPYPEIMARFSVTRLMVSKIKTGRTWKHVV